MLKQWDVQLDAIMRQKAKLCTGASPHGIHAGTHDGGLGIHTLTTVALKSGAAELQVRLNCKVTRLRWEAASKARARPRHGPCMTPPTRHFPDVHLLLLFLKQPIYFTTKQYTGQYLVCMIAPISATSRTNKPNNKQFLYMQSNPAIGGLDSTVVQ